MRGDMGQTRTGDSEVMAASAVGDSWSSVEGYDGGRPTGAGEWKARDGASAQRRQFSQAPGAFEMM